MCKSTIFCLFAVLMLLFGVTVPIRAQAGENSDGKAAIEQVLRTQVAAWNRHDLDAFMVGYLQN